MKTYIIRRLANVVPVLLGVSLLTFTTMYLLPGDPAELLGGQTSDPEAAQAIRKRYHLDQPLVVQYIAFLARLGRGDLGESLRSRRPVLRILAERFVVTLQVAAGALIFALVVGLPAGVIAATRPRSILDGACMLLALVGLSVPVFLLGLIMMILFTWEGSFFVPSGYAPLSIRHLGLPCLALGTVPAALLARMTRSSMLEVLSSDHVRAARAKGLAEWRVVIRHGLRNALIPILTIIGTSAASLLSGAVLTETVFSLPGLGRQIVDAIDDRDYPVVIGGVLWLAVTFVLVNLIVDLLYGALDPRIRYD